MWAASRLPLPTILFFCLFLQSCSNGDVPKPRGYFRIDLPEKHLIPFDSHCPYAFLYPDICRIVYDKGDFSEACWIDLFYPAFNAKIHISYKPVHNNLSDFLEDTRSMLMKHISRANAIKEKQFNNPERDVFATMYRIEGSSVASPLQFFATDSSGHFLRGALYFRVAPNNDSLKPVINFLVEDVETLLGTLRWK